MDEKKIKRINELYAKSKTPVGLTEEEKTEQKVLRQEYIQAIRGNLKNTLNQVEILQPDGSITKLSQDKHWRK